MPLMALDWRKSKQAVRKMSKSSGSMGTGDLGVIYGVLRLGLPLAKLPDNLSSDLGHPSERMDVAVFEHLVSGQLSRAFQSALRRARASGLRPKARVAGGTPRQARRLAAALAIPISKKTLRQVIERTVKPETGRMSPGTKRQESSGESA